MKKPQNPTGGPAAPGGAVSDPQLRSKFPTLLEYLATSAWEDGTAREPSTVTLFVEGGLIKVAVNDRSQKRSLYVTARTLQEALAAAEECLKDDSADWRPWSGGRKK